MYLAILMGKFVPPPPPVSNEHCVQRTLPSDRIFLEPN